MSRTLGKPVDEFVVHKVCARVPPFSQKMGGLDRKTSILEFNNSPIRFRHGTYALQVGCEKRKPTDFLLRSDVAQVVKRVQKSSLFPSGSTTRKSLILPSKSSAATVLLCLCL